MNGHSGIASKQLTWVAIVISVVGVDRGDDRVGAVGHGAGEGLVGEVADVLADAVELGRATGAADDGLAPAPTAQRAPGRSWRPPVRSRR